MTDRKQQQIGIAAQFSIAGAILALAVALFKFGAGFGIVSAEHKQILHETQQAAQRQDKMLEVLLQLADRKCP